MNKKQIFVPEPRPRVMKTNIKNIANHIVKLLADFGIEARLTCSNKSKSRYLEFSLREGCKRIVRISDHPAEKANRKKYAFDIHTIQRRTGSVDYIEFIDALKQIVGGKLSAVKKGENNGNR